MHINKHTHEQVETLVDEIESNDSRSLALCLLIWLVDFYQRADLTLCAEIVQRMLSAGG